MPEPRGQRRPRIRVAHFFVPLLAMAVSGCGLRSAVLEVSTSEIDFGSQLNQSTFDVKNAGRDGLLTTGVTPLGYHIITDKTWLTVHPESGDCGEGQLRTHVVEVDRVLLPSGSNIATISISSNAGPWSITVRADRDVTTCSEAPTAPSSPAPGHGATELPIGADLAWSDGASQCPGLTATYDVYFGTGSPPPFVQSSGTTKGWDPGTLAVGTTYYWRIVARDGNGSTPGPIWSFTTSAAACTAAPSAAALVAPANAATSVSIEQNLSWGSGDSQCPGLTATYDVYFGTTSSPPLDHNNGSAKTWDPGTLANATTYYWRIVAKDANGSTPGPIWSFTTAAAGPCLTLPIAPCLPLPASGAGGISENSDLAWGCGDSQCVGLVATYDVYFGTAATPGPGEFRGNTATKAWVLPTLAKDTRYYWQVVAKDANGSTPGAIWTFKTKK